MTGFGSASYEDDQIAFTVEIKTLNSKMGDINLRVPRLFSDKEVAIRSLISEILVRGKIMVNIESVVKDAELSGVTSNQELFRSFYFEFKKLADNVSESYDDIFRLAAQQPDVFGTKVTEETVEAQWLKLKPVITEAANACDSFRTSEGAALEPVLASYIDSISEALSEIEELDPARVVRIKQRVSDNFSNFLSEQKIDMNRMEQELLYYIEKLDISEEKVRLESHLKYFLKELGSSQSNGKTLGFIGQEIGREINTIGSKANDAEIQKRVVRMKEELEKVKEQILNIL